MEESKILLIYTGGTIGMITNPETGALQPFDFSHIFEYIPDLKQFKIQIDSISFDQPIDSSDIGIKEWIELVNIIENNYINYDGFVILHGTDTMAYSASALSFLIQNLNKPIIFTGSQLPIGMLRTDGKENLITAIEIAADKFDNGKPKVPEVCIYFENKLYRGNRTTKYNAEYFDAFSSPNYPPLAEAGIKIKYNRKQIFYPQLDQFPVFYRKMDENIAILKIFPGINQSTVKSILNIQGLKGIILETFGAGNAMSADWFISLLKEAIAKGIIIYNVSQCVAGSVNMDLYENGRKLMDIGVIGGADITLEAAVTKLMFLLGKQMNIHNVKILLQKNIAGEITL